MDDIPLGRVETVDELRRMLVPIRDDVPLVNAFDITIKEIDPFGTCLSIVPSAKADILAEQASRLPDQPDGTIE